MSNFLFTQPRTFVADHFHDLPGFEEPRHGHNWEMEATVCLDDLDGASRLSGILDAWVQNLDYSLLNTQARLADRNPTAEALAQWAWEHLEASGFVVDQVKIREKRNYWAACRRVVA